MLGFQEYRYHLEGGGVGKLPVRVERQNWRVVEVVVVITNFFNLNIQSKRVRGGDLPCVHDGQCGAVKPRNRIMCPSKFFGCYRHFYLYSICQVEDEVQCVVRT